MARRVQARDGDAAELEGFFVLWCPGYAVAVLAADDLEVFGAELGELSCQRPRMPVEAAYNFLVPAGMVPVATSLAMSTRKWYT